MIQNMFFVLLAALALSGCGSDNGGQDPKRLRIRDSLTQEDRSHACFLAIVGESEEGKKAFLDQVQGTWEFMLDFGRSIAAKTKYYSVGKDVEDISFNKVCVSQVLDSRFGIFEGFRLVELMASNNEGAVALPIKFETSTTENPARRAC